MLQDALGHVWAPLGRTSWYPSILGTSAVIVAAWGYFLWQGVRDPMGVNSLWPLFGIANQLLATVALCVATTIFLRMGRARYAWVTLGPLAWLTSVTFTASWHKIFNPDPRIGFLANAARLAQEAPTTAARAHEITRLMFNDRLDAVVTALLAISVSVILLESVLLWSRLLRGRQAAGVKEAAYVLTRFAPEESS